MVKLNNYNADEVEPAGSFDPLPAGEYTVVIEDTDEKDNKAGTGSYLKVVYNVVEGEYQGRKLFENLNLHFDDVEENEKHATAVKIANGKLRSICFAVGNHVPQDTEELHNIPFIVIVGLKKGNDDYPEPQNIIRKYKAVEGGEEPSASSAAPKTEKKDAAPAAGKSERPWQKKKK